jgi:hypothetical protein
LVESLANFRTAAQTSSIFARGFSNYPRLAAAFAEEAMIECQRSEGDFHAIFPLDWLARGSDPSFEGFGVIRKRFPARADRPAAADQKVERHRASRSAELA